MSAAPVTPARRSGDQPEAPVQVRLPSGTTVPVVAVNTTADGVLDVPEDIRTAGWWRGGSRLGDPFGPTVIAAHIDSRTQGLGPVRRAAQRRARRPDQGAAPPTWCSSSASPRAGSSPVRPWPA